MRKESLQWLIPVLLTLGAAAALWFYWMQTGQQERPVAQEQAEPRVQPEPEGTGDQPPEEPVHPLEVTREAATDEPELQPLPPLDESDEYFRMEATELFGEGLDEMLVDDQVIERVVATIDNLSRDQVAERIKPVAGAEGQFMVEERGEEEYAIDPENYRRYDNVVGLVDNADLEQTEELYRRFYPLFQNAYEELGYPQDYFNDRLVAVIDHLLETPDVDEPVTLIRPHVLYEYADPQLESLSPGQKLLLRIGSEHRATVKEKLREFRDRISEGEAEPVARDRDDPAR